MTPPIPTSSEIKMAFSSLQARVLRIGSTIDASPDMQAQQKQLVNLLISDAQLFRSLLPAETKLKLVGGSK
jgi:hypothetical protein